MTQQKSKILLGVVSDTHGSFHNTQAACNLLASFPVDVVIHCGDLGSVEIVPLFSAWPTHFVFGNVDNDRQALREAICRCNQHCHDDFGELELAGTRIAFLHGDQFRKLETAITCGDYDLICHGHTHEKRLETRGQATILNPGALFRADPISLALVQLPDLAITHLNVR